MLTSKDIALELHVSEQTVRRYARDGTIPFKKTPGGHRRFDLDAVRLALRMNEKHTFEPLPAESSSTFSSDPDGVPIQLASSRTLGRPFAEDSFLEESERPLGEIPFLGVPGSSRFVLDPDRVLT